MGPFSHPSAHSLLAVAKEFYRETRTLEAATTAPNLTAAFLAGFAVELVLKSYLVYSGRKLVQELKSHDLVKLWIWAAAVPGSPFAPSSPVWVGILNTCHDYPYLFRYRPGDLDGYQIPGPAHLEEIDGLIRAVDRLVSSVPPAASMILPALGLVATITS